MGRHGENTKKKKEKMNKKLSRIKKRKVKNENRKD
jgi:hypothetical protein